VNSYLHEVASLNAANVFNLRAAADIAAMRGNRDAIRLRREIADQMTEQDIAAAQRAARAWLTAH
jgi:hypothetical protein